MSRLLDAAGDAPFIFITGKGGTGKTTTAGALSLGLADSGTATHLISTDPAHSIADLFHQSVGGVPVTAECSPRLQLEEFDAVAAADAWLGRALAHVSAIVEAGTYLDGDDVAAFSRLALPGVDEMMAVLRLVEIADSRDQHARVVVDTAPTGHTLRLLDAADTHEGIARALRAMADKAAAVAGAMTGRAVRMHGEDIIDELERVVSTYRERVLDAAAFIVASRPGQVVEAETERLARELGRRKMRVAVVVTTGAGALTTDASGLRDSAAGAAYLRVPLLDDVTGCSGLRKWLENVGSGLDEPSGPGTVHGPAPAAAHGGRSATSGRGPAPGDWLTSTAPRLLLFAGKGGVGKSTCAAAAALALTRTRDVLLCSTDPAGSLGEVLDTAAPRPAERLRVMQIEPLAQMERLRASYEEDVMGALERLGLSASAALDRRVIETLWDLTPPGLDELAATAAMLGAAAGGETVVIDSSPTGHFLRLIEMPDVALGWTRQLMRIFVKYGIAGPAGGAAESILELSRDLRTLRDTLHDPESAAVIIVTLDEPMVRAETDRLTSALDGAGIRIAGLLVNRSSGGARTKGGTPTGGESARTMTAKPAARDRTNPRAAIHAPVLDPPPIGADALRRFVDTWKIDA